MFGIDKPTQQVAKDYLAAIPPYPSPPPHSHYARTMQLGHSIRADVASLGGGNAQINIYSTSPYSPYVIYADTQAWMHQGRWWTLESVFQSQLNVMIQTYEDWVHNSFV